MSLALPVPVVGAFQMMLPFAGTAAAAVMAMARHRIDGLVMRKA
jgi:hypothetical protein